MPRPLLEVQSLSKQFGLQTVLRDVRFSITEGQHVALIGRNGSGKTTLLQILTGEQEPDQGHVVTFDWTRIGVIRQQEVLPSQGTVLAYLEELTGRPSWDVRKQGAAFGLHAVHMDAVPTELSGGYQMRVKLTALFLQEPNLLLLDEPVNYLDLQTLLLLERVLEQYRGAYILVAHDRTLLEHTCDVTLEVERGELVTFQGTVSTYLAWKQEQRAFAERTNKKLAREIKHQQAFVDRFSAKRSLATRAQSKVKYIQRLRRQITDIAVDLSTARLSIPSPQLAPGLMVRVEGLSIGYGERLVASEITFDIARGEKVVLAGENGQGKSTLLKTLAGQIVALEGTVRWWKRADIGYYDQFTNRSLRVSDTVQEHLMRCAPAQMSAESILMMAGNMLFREEDLDKRISVLSGGERARLALAGVLLHEHNVLLLDEPTNHLDVETTEALAAALQRYTGTVIVVSHARTFVHAFAQRILEVGNATVRAYHGDYLAYVEDVEAHMEAEAREEVQDVEAVRERGREEQTERRAKQLAAREVQRAIQRTERTLATLDEERSALMKFFFENPTDYAPEKAQRLALLNAEYARAEQLWLKQQEELEQIRQ